jgi:hypothetical protein
VAAAVWSTDVWARSVGLVCPFQPFPLFGQFGISPFTPATEGDRLARTRGRCVSERRPAPAAYYILL